MPDRTYRVLALDPGAPRPEARGPARRDVFHDLGYHGGHDAKAAIEAALAETGLPEGVKVCVGVPESNWNAHDVEPDPRPQFKVTPRKPDGPLNPGKPTRP